MIDWRLGTMGFSYGDWAGVFYPRGTKPGDYLEYYSRHFDAVELDTTFHAVPPAGRARRWADVTPEGFRFCVKAPRAVTHDAPPGRGVEPMRQFLGVMEELGPKLAVVLLQFPPGFSAREFDGLRTLFDALAGGRADGPPRFAVEFRDDSWFAPAVAPAVARDLGGRNCAWVAADYGGESAGARATTDFLYLRWVGRHGQFARLDREQIDVGERLEWWGRRIEQAAKQPSPGAKLPDASPPTVWGFFNNDYAGYSVGTCKRFKRILGLPVVETDDDGQGVLFA